jgi:hypothetical protein
MLGDYTTNLNHNLSSMIKKNLDSSRFHENKSSKARAVFQPLHIFPFQRRWGAEWVKQLVTENIRYPVNNAWPRKQHRYFFCTFFFFFLSRKRDLVFKPHLIHYWREKTTWWLVLGETFFFPFCSMEREGGRL